MASIEQVETVDHRAEAEGLLALNSPTTFAVQTAQVHASLAIAEQLERANNREENDLQERLINKLTGWIATHREGQENDEERYRERHQAVREAFEDVLREVKR